MIPDGQGGFTAVDNINKPAPMPEVPEEDVSFVANSPLSDFTDFLSNNSFQFNKNLTGSVATEYDDDAKVKETSEIKKSFLKKTKPTLKSLEQTKATKQPLITVNANTNNSENITELEKSANSGEINTFQTIKVEASPKQIESDTNTNVNIDSHTIIDTLSLPKNTSKPKIVVDSSTSFNNTDNFAINEELIIAVQNNEHSIINNTQSLTEIFTEPFQQPAIASRFFIHRIV